MKKTYGIAEKIKRNSYATHLRKFGKKLANRFSRRKNKIIEK